MDWGEFLWTTRQHQDLEGRPVYAATWACISSFGVYGHHWSHMGEPFEVFVQTVGKDYLLGKIARRRMLHNLHRSPVHA